MTKFVHVKLKLPEDVAARLQLIADAELISLSALCRQALAKLANDAGRGGVVTRPGNEIDEGEAKRLDLRAQHPELTWPRGGHWEIIGNVTLRPITAVALAYIGTYGLVADHDVVIAHCKPNQVAKYGADASGMFALVKRKKEASQ